jgi:arylsulfatase A-like enzyme
LESGGPTLSGCTNPKWNGTIRPAPRHAGTLPSAVTLPRPPSFNEADMSDKPAYLRTAPQLTSADIGCLTRQYRDRLESLRAVDDLIGGIVNTLSANGELGNSVIIFTSDNGFFFGEHRLTDKVLGYEPSIKVPLVIRAPGFTGAKTTDRFVLNNDLAPTIAAFAGVVPGLPVDGRSLIPLLKNPTEMPWRKRFLVEYLGLGGESGDPIMGLRLPFSALRTTPLDSQTPERFYVEWNDTPKSRELYNFVTDPDQMRSEHANPALSGVRTAMAGWLARLKTCGKGTCRILEDQ